MNLYRYFSFFICICFFISTSTACAQQKNMQSKTAKSKMITPPYLQPGDTIAIVAPAGILKNKQQVIEKAVEMINGWGFHVVFGKNLYKQNNHFSGTDQERAADVQQALDDPTIKAIWAARGGYGSVRILDKLDFTKFLQQPKWFIGYSDITAFHSHIHNLGVQTIHGMMAVSVDDDAALLQETIETFKKAIFGKIIKYEIDSSEYNKIGEAEGEIVGGNLTLLSNMLGSKSSINTDGKILFFEEIGEYKYHIDRMLQSLKRAGYFTNCKGVIVGDMTKIKTNSTPWGSSTHQLIFDALKEYDFPIIFNFPAGHEADNRALILGRKIKMTVTKDKSTLIFK